MLRTTDTRTSRRYQQLSCPTDGCSRRTPSEPSAATGVEDAAAQINPQNLAWAVCSRWYSLGGGHTPFGVDTELAAATSTECITVRCQWPKTATFSTRDCEGSATVGVDSEVYCEQSVRFLQCRSRIEAYFNSRKSAFNECLAQRLRDRRTTSNSLVCTRMLSPAPTRVLSAGWPRP